MGEMPAIVEKPFHGVVVPNEQTIRYLFKTI